MTISAENQLKEKEEQKRQFNKDRLMYISEIILVMTSMKGNGDEDTASIRLVADLVHFWITKISENYQIVISEELPSREQVVEFFANIWADSMAEIA